MNADSMEITALNQEISYAGPGLVTSNPRMLRIIDIARRVAQTDVPVLILGESGVGKDVLAGFIHRQSDCANGPLVKVNCAALPDELLESELFGYDRGAFTGAASAKPGKFDLAHNGTLFLDEIGEMSPHLQAKLLHVLQDGEFSRLGGRWPTRVNVRVLAATNRNLQEAVRKREFRSDLYFRLNVINVEIPPLRERRDDILPLCQYFLEKYRERYGSSIKTLPQDLLEACVWCDWPGNIRQLENTVKRYLILPDSGIVSELRSAVRDAMPATALCERRHHGNSQPATSGHRPPLQVQSVSRSLKQVGEHAAEQAEKAVALDMLAETGWNQKESARLLQISYKAFRNRLRRWQLSSGQRTKAKAVGST
jgi:two-component system response regulator AtoC